jgi:glycosyltransferase involved in cell wall biosynthesis
MLGHLLSELQMQKTAGRFSYSILVIDNDEVQSAQPVVTKATTTSVIPIDYYVAAEKNVAVARNCAVQHATGDLIAFIDDDEIPPDTWLLTMFQALELYGADGVLGPVKPIFDPEPPSWILKAKIFDRPSHASGMVLHWDMTRTGNVLIRRSVFPANEPAFDPSFTHGEDKDFFRRMIAKGYLFVWCDEAPVYEKETADRFALSYFLKRALIRGGVAIKHRGYSGKAVAKAVMAVALYGSILPLLAIRGHHVFMMYLIKLCDHLGTLLAACGVDVEKHSSKV